MILTDKDYTIIQLMRTHEYTADVKTAIGETYPFTYAAKMNIESFDLSTERFEELAKEDEKEVIPAKMAKKFA